MDMTDEATPDLERELDAELAALAPVLAEAADTDPPADLLAGVLAAATARRAPGATIDAGAAPMRALDALRDTSAELAALLHELTPEEWHAPTHESYGTVHGLVSHLVGVEELTAAWLTDDAVAATATEHVAASRAAMAELTSAPAADVAARWYATAQRVFALAAEAPSDRPIMAADIPTDADGMLLLRTFEVWAHTDDVCRATARPRPRLDAGRLGLMSSRLVDVLPVAVALDGGPEARGTVQIVLTGPGGGAYVRTFAAGEAPATPPTARIVTDAVDLCLVAARRLDRSDLVAEIEGDRALAERVLAAAGAFARD
jgi:uncharacterized protein (TIGR03083 family)